MKIVIRRFGKWHLSAGFSATLVLLCALLPTASHANALSDAWNCAKKTYQSQYLLLSKGAKATQVLGAAPQCVAQAIAPDIPLLTVSGAMFAVNAIDPQMLPASSQCLPKLKTTAVRPIGELLDTLAGGVLPPSLLSATSTEAQNQLWNYLNTTPPFAAVTQRADCGCTFLEAGISVETVKEVLSAIAKTGAACDQFLDNVPGYGPLKSAVSAGAYELNNALEGVFTDQTKHKPPQDYYLYDFGGHPRSAFLESHAVQTVLNPAHDPATQAGAKLRFDRFVWAGGGAYARNTARDACVSYFDEHTMSESNAQKVCNGFVAQFKADVKRRAARIKAISQLLSSLPAQVNPLLAETEIRCQQAWSKLANSGDQVVACKRLVSDFVGGISLVNPYTSLLDSFGLALSAQEVNEILKGSTVVYFAADHNPQDMNGVYRMAYDALLNRNLDDPTQAAEAVTQALAIARKAVAMRIDQVDADETERAAVRAKQVQEQALQEMLQAFANDVGKTTLGKCPSVITNECQGQLFKAWQMCDTKIRALPIMGEFPTTAEQAKITALRNQCSLGYTHLVQAIGDWTNNVVAEYGFASGVCSGGAATSQQAACNQDNLSMALACWGGLPALEASYLSDGLVRQRPEKLGDCSGLRASFSDKWRIDEEELQLLALASQQANNLCAQLPTGSTARAACNGRVAQATDKCGTHIRNAYETLIPGQRIYTVALSQAVVSLKATANRCQQRVVDQAQDELNRQAAPLKAVELFASQCPPANRTGDWNATCRAAIANAVTQCLKPTSTSTTTTPFQAPNIGTVTIPTNLQLNTFTLGNGLSLSVNVDSVNNTAATALSLPVGTLEFNVPTLVDKLLYSPDELVSGCQGAITQALDQVRRDYVAAWPLRWPTDAEDARTILAARGIGCTAAAAGRGGYNFTCSDGTPLQSCQVLLNARAPGVFSCIASATRL
jgi:hypothetical protein